MSALAKFIAVQLAEAGIDWADWPEDAEACKDNWEVIIEGWEGEDGYNIGWECTDEFPYLEEYDDHPRLTKEEFEDFILKQPNYVAEITAKRKKVVGEIARLNKVAYDAVKEAIKLSHSVDLPYSCSMPSGVADMMARSLVGDEVVDDMAKEQAERQARFEALTDKQKLGVIAIQHVGEQLLLNDEVEFEDMVVAAEIMRDTFQAMLNSQNLFKQILSQ